MTKHWDDSEFQQEEWRRIHHRRRVAFEIAVDDDEGNSKIDQPDDLVGLSLSGGGLRSAMFNDGFLQGLSHRGLLRYVDYLCSVSGGGYIASHLATRKGNGVEKNFHADGVTAENDEQETTSNSQFLPWHLGRNPESGVMDSSRMVHAGQYLANTLNALLCYSIGFITNALVYMGILGVIASLIAVFYRSFDMPDFRFFYETILGFVWGDELTIAFIPSILIGVLWVMSVFLWMILVGTPFFTGLSSGSLRSGHFKNLRDYLLSFLTHAHRWLLVLFVASIVLGVAVFLGNDITQFQQGNRQLDERLQLNKFAQYLALIAAGIQVVAFLGRDRLFRSEKDEAKHWQHVAQKAFTFGVVAIAIFAMIHWMAHENISRYTHNRSEYLVRGDVRDWAKLHAIFEAAKEFDSSQDSAIRNGPTAEGLEMTDTLRRPYTQLLPIDPWESHLTYDWLTNGDDILSLTTRPPIPMLDENSSRHLSKWTRIQYACQAYLQSNFGFSVTNRFRSHWNNYESLVGRRLTAIEIWNRQLESPQTTQFLLAFSRNQKESVSQLTPALDWVASEHSFVQDLRENENPLGLSQQSLLLKEFHSPIEELEKLARVSFNRKLIQSQFNNVLCPCNVASTYVVARHDQYARGKWLILWMAFVAVGLLLNRFRSRMLFVYGFYRDSIRKTFLDSSDVSLAQLKPTDVGLPHPILLACRLIPSSDNGHYRVDSERFAFTPTYCGMTESVDESWPTDNVMTSADSDSISVSDAATMSGAAVTPLMTENPWFSLILSFFGTGLGRWLILKPSEPNCEFARRIDRVIFFAMLQLMIGIFLLLLALKFTVVASGIVVIIIATVVHSLRKPNGVLAFLMAAIRAMIGQQATKDVYGQDMEGRMIGHIADGGFYDYLGATELLRRRCSLVVVSDAGAHLNNDSLKPLASLVEYATAELGIQVLDLDHDAPIDFRRLELSGSRQVHQPFLCARIRYPELSSKDDSESANNTDDNNLGLLVYCQMAITKNDPLEIQQIRNRFPSFPDEPTSNQFYTDEQVAAYRNLGFHIANRMCSELHRWSTNEIRHSGFCLKNSVKDSAEQIDQINLAEESPTQRQPLMNTILQRLQTAFRLSCYEEKSYRRNDIFSEAIWTANDRLAPAAHDCFYNMASRCCEIASKLHMSELLKTVKFSREAQHMCDLWISMYEGNADLRARYRSAVVSDINSLDDVMDCKSALLFQEIMQFCDDRSDAHDDVMALVMACHLATLAVACHEIHRGRPAAVFQVGGREKLIALVIELSQALNSAIATSASEIGDAAKTFVGELMEMKKCTFQEGELQTTISFAQCLITMWGRLGHDCVRIGSGATPANIKQKIETDLEAVSSIVENIREQGVELAATQVRIWLHDSLKENNIVKVVRALRKGWCVAYFTNEELTDTGQKRRRTAKEKTTRKTTKKKKYAK